MLGSSKKYTADITPAEFTELHLGLHVLKVELSATPGGSVEKDHHSVRSVKTTEIESGTFSFAPRGKLDHAYTLKSPYGKKVYSILNTAPVFCWVAYVASCRWKIPEQLLCFRVFVICFELSGCGEALYCLYSVYRILTEHISCFTCRRRKKQSRHHENLEQ